MGWVRGGEAREHSKRTALLFHAKVGIEVPALHPTPMYEPVLRSAEVSVTTSQLLPSP